MKRVAVVGTTGSGKTAVARQLAQALNVPHVELDALYWGPNWTEPPVEVFRARVARALSGEAWVADGNYSKVRDIVWRQADTLVWLDVPLWLVLWHLVRRTMQRIVRQERLWSGNRERLRTGVFSRNSLFVWALRTYWRRRRDYTALPRQPEYAHLILVRLRSPGQTQAWLAAMAGPHDMDHSLGRGAHL